MKKKSKEVITLLILIVLTSLSFGQTNEIFYRDKVVGKYKLNGKDIVAHEIEFPGKIAKMYFDSSSNNVTLQIFGSAKGAHWTDRGISALLYNLNGDSAVWIKADYGFLNQNGNIIIETTKTESFRVDNATGKRSVLLKNQVAFIDVRSRTGLDFMPYKPGKPSELVGVNLDNGDIKWRKKVPRSYPNYVWPYLNDSTVLLTGAGLHSINLNNGEGWDYNTVTGDKGYNDVDQDAPSRFWGIVGGTYSKFDARGLLLQISSNIIKDSNYCYFASREALAKLNKKDGHIIWTYNFKKDEVGSSFIFSRDDTTLCIFNTGSAIKDGKWIEISKPFIAAFNKDSGQKIYQTLIADQKDEILQIFYRLKPLYILYKHKVATYDLSDGSFITQTATSSKSGNDENISFFSNKMYTNGGDSIVPVFNLIDSTKTFAKDSEDQVLEFENDLTFRKSKIGVFYTTLAIKNGLNVIHKTHSNAMFVVDKANNVIAAFNAPSASQLIGDKLYGIENKTVTVVDLTEILK